MNQDLWGDTSNKAPNFNHQDPPPPVNNMSRAPLTLPQLKGFSRTITKLSSDLTILTGAFTFSHAVQQRFLSLRARITDFKDRVASLTNWIETRERREARGREGTGRQVESEWSSWDGIERDWEDFIAEIEELKGRLEKEAGGDGYGGVVTKFKVLGNGKLTREMREKKKEVKITLKDWEKGPDGEIGGKLSGFEDDFGPGSGSTSVEKKIDPFAPAISRIETFARSDLSETKVTSAYLVSRIARRSPSITGEKAPNNKKSDVNVPPVFQTFRQNKNSTSDKPGPNNHDKRKSFKEGTREMSSVLDKPSFMKLKTPITYSYNSAANSVNTIADSTERIRGAETPAPEDTSFHADEFAKAMSKNARDSNPKPKFGTSVSSFEKLPVTNSRRRNTSVSQRIPSYIASPEQRAFKKLKHSRAPLHNGSSAISPNSFFGKRTDTKPAEQDYIVIHESPPKGDIETPKSSPDSSLLYPDNSMYLSSFYSKNASTKAAVQEESSVFDGPAESAFKKPRSLTANPYGHTSDPNTSFPISSNRSTSTDMPLREDVAFLDGATERAFKTPKTTSHNRTSSIPPRQSYSKGIYDSLAAQQGSVKSDGAVKHVVKKVSNSTGSAFIHTANSMAAPLVIKDRRYGTPAAQEMASILEKHRSKKLKTVTAASSNRASKEVYSFRVNSKHSLSDTPWMSDGLNSQDTNTLTSSRYRSAANTSTILPEFNEVTRSPPAAQATSSLPNKPDVQVKESKTHTSLYTTSSDLNTASTSVSSTKRTPIFDNYAHQTSYPRIPGEVMFPSLPDHLRPSSSVSSSSQIPISGTNQDITSTSTRPNSTSNPDTKVKPTTRLRPRAKESVQDTEVPDSDSDSDDYKPLPTSRVKAQKTSQSMRKRTTSTSTMTIADSDADSEAEYTSESESEKDIKYKPTRRQNPPRRSIDQGYRIGTTTRAGYKEQLLEEDAERRMSITEVGSEPKPKQKTRDGDEEGDEDEDEEPVTRRRRSRKSLEEEEAERERLARLSNGSSLDGLSSWDGRGEDIEMDERDGRVDAKAKAKAKVGDEGEGKGKRKGKGKAEVREEDMEEDYSRLRSLPDRQPKDTFTAGFAGSAFAEELASVSDLGKVAISSSDKDGDDEDEDEDEDDEDIKVTTRRPRPTPAPAPHHEPEAASKSKTKTKSKTKSKSTKPHKITTSTIRLTSPTSSSSTSESETVTAANARLEKENKALRRALRIAELTRKSLQGEVVELGFRLQRKVREFAEGGMSDSEEGLGG